MAKLANCGTEQLLSTCFSWSHHVLLRQVKIVSSERWVAAWPSWESAAGSSYTEDNNQQPANIALGIKSLHTDRAHYKYIYLYELLLHTHLIEHNTFCLGLNDGNISSLAVVLRSILLYVISSSKNQNLNNEQLSHTPDEGYLHVRNRRI